MSNGLTDYPVPNPWRYRGVALTVAALVIALAWLIPESSRFGILFFARNSSVYPLTIQNLEHLLLAIGIAELAMRLQVARWELTFLDRGFLPEDPETILQAHDLGPIRQSVMREFDEDNGFLPNLIDLCVLQFQSSRSVALTSSVMKDALDMISQRVDLRYQVSRYIVWLLPTVGFIGTVYGIAGTLEVIEASNTDDPELLKKIAAPLALAFDTTIVALIESGILMLLMHVAQEREERSANRAGEYTLRHLINRLYSA